MALAIHSAVDQGIRRHACSVHMYGRIEDQGHPFYCLSPALMDAIATHVAKKAVPA